MSSTETTTEGTPATGMYPEPRTWWEVPSYSDSPRPITVVGETAKMLIVSEQYAPGLRRIAQEGRYRTYAEARAAMIHRQEAAVLRAQERLAFAENELLCARAIPEHPPERVR